jgi:hypothetical protein
MWALVVHRPSRAIFAAPSGSVVEVHFISLFAARLKELAEKVGFATEALSNG